MTAEPVFDAIVIGGGPGGSTTATLLARKGARVLLLERERFPREHVGESLLPATMPILEELGVMEAVEAAGFLKKWGASMVWGSSSEPWSWYFRETNRQHPHSYQVVRAQFDQILLDNARASGVEVREGRRVTDVLRDGERVTGVRYVNGDGDGDGDGAEQEAHARFVVDASGQHALLANALGLREWDSFFRNLAVYGYFAGARRLPEPDETNILVEAHEHGWCWTIPLQGDRASVGTVVDADRAREAIEGGDLERFLLDSIARAPHTAALVEGATLEGKPQAVRDWSYVSRALIGDGYVLVGDAACFIDPLFSSGVHLAMNAGVLAAAYVTTALRDEQLAAEARPVYERLYLQQYHHFRELAKLFYSSNRTADSYFWEARRVTGGDLDATAREAFVDAVAGQPPQGYERVVIDRGEAPVVFLDAVRATEEERERRQRDVDALASRIGDAVPLLAEGAAVVVEPVFEGGEFVRGFVIRTATRPAGVQVSSVIGEAVKLINGERSIADLAAELARAHGLEHSQVAGAVASAAGILYVDGVIAELRSPAPA